MRVVIAGGSGFLGQSLTRFFLERNVEVIILSRQSPPEETDREETDRTERQPKFLQWDSRTLGDWIHVFDGADAVVNLTGRTVDCIKTPAHCDEILRSRVESTWAIGRAISSATSPPPVWVQMSTAHIHGDPPQLWCDEDSATGYGLAPEVAKAWEAACLKWELPETRRVILRTSFVIGRNGGALVRLRKLTKWGFGGTIGDGKQGISWIHEQDLNNLFWRAITHPDMTGAYLATAPNPVSNKIFMRELRKALRVPIGLPAARWMVRIGAPLFLRTDPELAICGRYCKSTRLEKDGYQFEFPELPEALANVYS